jgi:surfactin synthase thioesterase subunit
MIDRKRESLELLSDFMAAIPEAEVHVVRNLYLGSEKKFELFNCSKMKSGIEGKGSRSINLPELADRVTEIVAPVIDRPMAIFGHSMGASLGYEIARRLTDRGIDPELLVVSGRRAPSAVRDERFHEKSDDEFIAEIGRLGGTETDLLADPEVRAMVLPAVRADYRLAELYRHTPGTEPRCPVLALVGDADPKADIDEVRRWADHSDGPFELEVFPGGHFYLNGAVPRVLEHIRSRLLG